jgi:hypothetical protein
MKTNFSFDVHYSASSGRAPGHVAAGATPAQREDVMRRLQALLQAQFEPLDAGATVQATDSQRGASHKIVELVTTLPDDQIATVLKAFCETHGVTISALE